MKIRMAPIMALIFIFAVGGGSRVQALTNQLPFIKQNKLPTFRLASPVPPPSPVREQFMAIHKAYQARGMQTYANLVDKALTEALQLKPAACLGRQRELLSLGKEVGFDGLEPLALAYHDCAAISNDHEEMKALASVMMQLQRELWFNADPAPQIEATRGALHVLIAQQSPTWTFQAGAISTNALQLDLQRDIYAALQDVESNLPIPQNSETIAMGSFNVATGNFSGKTSQQQVRFIGGKPRIITSPASETIDAVNVRLRFNFQSRGLVSLRVFTNGVRTIVPAMQNSITIDLGKAREVAWRIETNLFSVQDKIVVHRSDVVSGAGAFTVEALPITILYEPPQYGDLRSSTKYAVTKSIGSSMSIAESTETSEAQVKFGTLSALVNKLDGVAKVLTLFNATAAKGTKAAASLIAKLVGEATITNTEGTEVTSEHTVDLQLSESIILETGAGLGPGRGDRIFYFGDVQIAWVMERGEVSFTILSVGSLGGFTVETLKADLKNIEAGEGNFGPLTGLSEDGLHALLDLDPFAFGGAHASLPPTHFACAEPPIKGDGGSLSYKRNHSISTTDLTREKHFQSRVVNFKSGWIDRLLNGAPLSGSRTMTTTHTTTRKVQLSETVSAEIVINAPVGDPYHLNVYYDSVFGTFAAKETSTLTLLGLNDACGSGPPKVFGGFGAVSGTTSGSSQTPTNSFPIFRTTLGR